jgi:class 3 adenylate cyclase
MGRPQVPLTAVLEAIHSLLKPETAGEPVLASFRTVVFTDIVESTEYVRRVGDKEGRATIRKLEQQVASFATNHGGRVVCGREMTPFMTPETDSSRCRCCSRPSSLERSRTNTGDQGSGTRGLRPRAPITRIPEDRILRLSWRGTLRAPWNGTAIQGLLH